GRSLGEGKGYPLQSNKVMLCPVRSVEGAKDLPGVSFMRALIPFKKAPSGRPSSSTLTPKAFGRFGVHFSQVLFFFLLFSYPPPQWLEETSAQGFRQLLELNLLGTYTLTKLALPHLRKSRGNVINISSLVGAIGQSQAAPYVATKGAVTALTKALALDESQYGVRVNCISPGNIWTPLWEELAASTPDPTATIREGTLAQPLGRMGQPAEVAAAAVFLASEASFCTGTELLVTGGAELGYGRKAGQAAPAEAPTTPP
ncbi:hypothetical protein FD754_013191, partial [Muntiacus muntjak]